MITMCVVDSGSAIPARLYELAQTSREEFLAHDGINLAKKWLTLLLELGQRQISLCERNFPANIHSRIAAHQLNFDPLTKLPQALSPEQNGFEEINGNLSNKDEVLMNGVLPRASNDSDVVREILSAVSSTFSGILRTESGHKRRTSEAWSSIPTPVDPVGSNFRALPNRAISISPQHSRQTFDLGSQSSILPSALSFSSPVVAANRCLSFSDSLNVPSSGTFFRRTRETEEFVFSPLVQPLTPTTVATGIKHGDRMLLPLVEPSKDHPSRRLESTTNRMQADSYFLAGRSNTLDKAGQELEELFSHASQYGWGRFRKP